jgi:hypothetical protein
MSHHSCYANSVYVRKTNDKSAEIWQCRLCGSYVYRNKGKR